MLRILANDAHDALAVNNLAFITHFLDRRPDFHLLPLASLKSVVVSKRLFPAQDLGLTTLDLFIAIRDPSAF